MVRRLVGVVIALVAAVALAAGPVAAHHGDRRRGDAGWRVGDAGWRVGDARGRVEIRGRVIGVDPFAHAFHVRAHDDFDADVVQVYVDDRTDFEFKQRRRGDFDVDARGLRFLRVGDAVEVEGRVIGRRAVLAREVEVFRRHRDDGGFVTPYPGAGAPYPVIVAPPRVVVIPAPVVVYPRPTTIVTGPQFILIGRAPIGSRVVVQVVAVFGSSVVRNVTYDAYADATGGFSVPIHTASPGAQHRITTWSVVDGAHSAPAVLVVYRR